MNKPAPKEPSMDEILSSIRQIIADDDALPRPSGSGGFARPADPVMPGFNADAPEPLALSAEQIVETGATSEPEAVDFSAFVAEAAGSDEVDLAPPVRAEFLDPEDIAFEPEVAAAPQPMPPEPPARPAAVARPVPPHPVSPAPAPAPVRPRTPTSEAAPMPDRTLSGEIADQLLEPATNAAVRANFARLNNLALGNSGLTIEAMMRDMMRPMLKEWLDEHLPAVVERMVEKEIARISRGVD